MAGAPCRQPGTHLLKNVDGVEIDHCSELRLQLAQAEGLPRLLVQGHGVDGILAEDNDVPRGRRLHQQIAAFRRHARHTEDARELVHVKWVAAQLFDRERACLQQPFYLQQAMESGGCCLDIRSLDPQVWHDSEPVDVHRHGRAGAQVGELLPPDLHPVALARRLALQLFLVGCPCSSGPLEFGHDGLGVLEGLGRQQRPYALQITFASILQRRQRQWR
eukprot:scaffold95_cov109-Isochrysis_galbana.AAC.4